MDWGFNIYFHFLGNPRGQTMMHQGQMHQGGQGGFRPRGSSMPRGGAPNMRPQMGANQMMPAAMMAAAGQMRPMQAAGMPPQMAVAQQQNAAAAAAAAAAMQGAPRANYKYTQGEQRICIFIALFFDLDFSLFGRILKNRKLPHISK